MKQKKKPNSGDFDSLHEVLSLNLIIAIVQWDRSLMETMGIKTKNNVGVYYFLPWMNSTSQKITG